MVKKELYNNIKISPLKNDRYIILENIKYKNIIVPKGYTTNGANIPRIFWSIWPPNRSDYMPAVIIHDYLCDLEDYDKADEYFLEILKILKISKTTIFLFYNFVRIYHKIKY
jgi:hypothetical protein